MPLIEPRDKVAVFIDGQFFVKGLEVTCPGQRFDFHKIAQKLVRPGRLTRAWYYDAPPPPYLPPARKQAQANFMKVVDSLPYFSLCQGRLQERTRWVRPCSQHTKIRAKYWEQKGVDVRLAIDMAAKAHRREYDAAVLISGDSDFVDLVKLVKEMGLHVFNATSPPNPSRQYHPSYKLRRACDDHIIIDAAFLTDCGLSKGSGPTGATP